MAEDSPAAQLIAVEMEYPDFAELLNDIRAFDWKLMNHPRKEDLARVASTGFRFATKGPENQRMELKNFLFNHPSCMASDFEMIIGKLTIFARLYSLKKAAQQAPAQPATPQQPAIEHKPKKKPKKVVIVEEESYEEDYEEEEEEEQPKRRKGRKNKR